MRTLESVLNEALKLPPDERRQLAARLLEEGDAGSARQDERLEAMREAAGDELFLADLADGAGLSRSRALCQLAPGRE